MNLSELIGKEVTAIGDCGLTKDKEVKGILKSHNGTETIVEGKRYLHSVNPNTVKVC